MSQFKRMLKLTNVLPKIALLLIFFIGSLQHGFGQKLTQSPFWNKDLENIAAPNSKKGWLEFRDDVRLNARNLFKEHRDAFKLSVHDEMRERGALIDPGKFKHYRFEQFHKGVRIIGSEYMVHEDTNGKIVSSNGKIAEALNVDVQANLTEKEALLQAFNFIDPKDGLWNKQDEKVGDTTIKASTYYPKGNLVLCKKRFEEDFSSTNLILVWTFDLLMAKPAVSVSISIDAKTGELVDQFPLEMECVPGKVATPWYGDQSISVDQQNIDGNTSFILLDNCTGSHPFSIHTLAKSGDDLREIRSSNNRWDNSSLEIAGGTVHWGVHQAMDYFQTAHSRSSWNDDNGDLVAYIEPGYGNAQWTSANRLRFGLGSANDSDPSNDWTTIDIVGHEFTHGVTKSSAGLRYRRESGALNESFSDIFGELVERFARGKNDWLMGDDRGTPIRNMSNPRAYQDNRWIDTENCNPNDDNDYCGVHTNSRVQNYWFYLLTEGGKGTNYFGERYDVKGIGIERAAEIAYLALTAYLGSEDGYIEAREATLRAARQLYGACSNEEVQVGKAWYAVHVGNELGKFDYEVCGNQDEGFFQGINSVISGGNGCNSNVSAQQGSVTFAAGNYVSLRPGFRAIPDDNNRFRAYIEGCSFTVLRSANTFSTTPIIPSPIGEREANLSVVEKGEIIQPLLRSDMTISPNPFSANTTIKFSITTEAAKTELSIWDIHGKQIQNLSSTFEQSVGNHQVNFDGSNLPAGVYFARLISGNTSQTMRLVIAR